MAIKSSRAQSCILYLSSGCSERRSPPPPISGLAGLSASAGEAAPARRIRRSVSTKKTHVYWRRNPVPWTPSDISVDRLFGSICAGETVAGLAVDLPRPPTTTDNSPDGNPAVGIDARGTHVPPATIVSKSSRGSVTHADFEHDRFFLGQDSESADGCMQDISDSPPATLLGTSSRACTLSAPLP